MKPSPGEAIAVLVSRTCFGFAKSARQRTTKLKNFNYHHKYFIRQIFYIHNILMQRKPFNSRGKDSFWVVSLFQLCVSPINVGEAFEYKVFFIRYT